jgi:hypothetical protein
MNDAQKKRVSVEHTVHNNEAPLHHQKIFHSKDKKMFGVVSIP